MGRSWVDDFQGAVLAEVDGVRYVAVRTDAVVSPPWIAPSLIIGAATLEQALSLIDRLEAKQEELARAQVRTFGTSLKWVDLAPTLEEDLVFPQQFKQDLLSYLDAFWRAAPTCQALRIAPSRGVLFVGRPRTGKSLAVRHLLGRSEKCRRFIEVQALQRPWGGVSRLIRHQRLGVREARLSHECAQRGDRGWHVQGFLA